MELPYSKKRLYLSGIDWLIATMDRHSRRSSGVGNHSTLILEFENPISTDALRERLAEIAESLPIISGRAARDLINLAPYWKTWRNNPPLPLETANATDNAEFNAILQQTLNRPFASKREHFRFIHIRRGKRGDALLMTFDHKLLDAKGAELFLNLLADDYGRDATAETAAAFSEGLDPVLRNWSAQFEAGRTVQRKMIAASKEGCFGAADYAERIGEHPEKHSASFHAEFAEFDEKTTARVSRAAEENAGFMMETPFLLAVTARALQKTVAPDTHMRCFVPVPLDTRSKPPRRGETFFNHISFAFFHLDIPPEASIKTISRDARRQLMETISDDFPGKMETGTRPLRIFPLPFLAKAMDMPFNGKICSFAFANVGESAAPENILGVPLTALRHMPRTPTPPSLGVFFNSHRKKLAATLSVDSNAWKNDFAEKMRNSLEEELEQTLPD
jgi:nitroreductase